MLLRKKYSDFFEKMTSFADNGHIRVIFPGINYAMRNTDCMQNLDIVIPEKYINHYFCTFKPQMKLAKLTLSSQKFCLLFLLCVPPF